MMTENLATSSRTFEVRPNCSSSREGMIVFFVCVVFLTLFIALRFVLLGAWLVVPFALLELLVLGVALYLFERNSRYAETITISHDSIRFRAQLGMKVINECSFQAYWVKVVLRVDQTSWYPSQLLLTSHGHSVEVGACLTDDDRKALAAELQTSLAYYQQEK